MIHHQPYTQHATLQGMRSREREREKIFQAPLSMICSQDEGGATLAGSLILKFGHILLYTALSSPQ